MTSQLVREVKGSVPSHSPVVSDSVRPCPPGILSVHGILQVRRRSGWPRLSPGDLSDWGIEPMSLKSAALVGRLSTTRQPGGLFVKNRLWPSLSCTSPDHSYHGISSLYRWSWTALLKQQHKSILQMTSKVTGSRILPEPRHGAVAEMETRISWSVYETRVLFCCMMAVKSKM